jgi:hypothetical protein
LAVGVDRAVGIGGVDGAVGVDRAVGIGGVDGVGVEMQTPGMGLGFGFADG